MTRSLFGRACETVESATDLLAAGYLVAAMELSGTDSLRVLDLLKNPPAPTSRLLAAAKARCGRV